MQAFHSTASYHLETARTLRMLERLYWWIGVSMVTQLLKVPSTENVAADGQVAHHPVALAGKARHRRQRRAFRPSPGDASN